MTDPFVETIETHVAADSKAAETRVRLTLRAAIAAHPFAAAAAAFLAGGLLILAAALS